MNLSIFSEDYSFARDPSDPPQLPPFEGTTPAGGEGWWELNKDTRPVTVGGGVRSGNVPQGGVILVQGQAAPSDTTSIFGIDTKWLFIAGVGVFVLYMFAGANK